MRPACVLVAVAACGGAPRDAGKGQVSPPAEPPVARAISVDEWLASSLHASAGPRALLLGMPRWALDASQLVPGGLGDEAVTEELTVVGVAETTEVAARIVIEWGGVRLLLWVGRDALASTVNRVITSDEARVRIAPGARVIEQGRDGERVSAVVTDGSLFVDARLPADAVDWTWTSALQAEPDPWDEGDVELPRGTKIYGTQAMRTVIATAASHAYVRLVRELDSGVLEIQSVSSPLQVRGFVDAPPIEGAMGWGTLGPKRTELRVPEGACLFDRADGARIGVALDELNDDGGEMLGWASTTVEVMGVLSTFAARFDGSRADPRFEMCATPSDGA